MRQILICFFIFTNLTAYAQVAQGTINYSGRVTHMYRDGYQIEIPYEQQNTDEVFAAIYFDSSNIEVDLIATIAYTLNVTHQKQKGWLLYLERFGSDRLALATTYDSIPVFTFDQVKLNYDTTKMIAGYSCHLAEYQLAGIPYESWFCEEFELGANLLPVPDEIPGACLEFTIQLEIADVKYTVSSLELTAPNSNRFKMIIPSDYVLEGDPTFPVEQTKKREVERERVHDESPPPPPVFHGN